ncbi:SurA N-terminal domain-containing protein [Candidatus Omnitrophota bacterium]
MLKTFRKKGVAKKILIALALIIVPAFVLWGPSTTIRDRSSANVAGLISGKKVSIDEYRENFLATRNEAIIKLGENFFKMQNVLDLNRETWDRIILLREAKSRKIKVSDTEVQDRIRSYPFFQKNDQFDYKLYEQILQHGFRTSSLDFEAQTRDSVKLEKLYAQITEDISFKPDELWEAYKKENEQIKISYIQILPDDLKQDVALTDEEIQSYFEERKENFKEPLKVNIEYVGFEFPEEATDSQKEEIMLKFQALGEDAQQEPDFETLSEKHVATFKETDFFSQEGPVKGFGWNFEFIELAFQLQENQISQPIETPKGYYLLRLKEKKEAHLPELKDVKQRIETILRDRKARELAEKKADAHHAQLQELFDASPESFDFNKSAQTLSLEVKQTPLFTYGKYVPDIGASEEFSETAFGLLEPDSTFELTQTQKGFYIIALDEHIKADEETFSEEKEQFQSQYLQKKKYDEFNKFFLELKLRAKLLDHIGAAARTPSL